MSILSLTEKVNRIQDTIKLKISFGWKFSQNIVEPLFGHIIHRAIIGKFTVTINK